MGRIAKKVKRQANKYLLGGLSFDDEYPAAVTALGECDIGPEDRISKLIMGIPNLLQAIEDSYSLYEEKNKLAVRNLELSSEELNRANKNLEHLNISVKAMLESLGPALLFFDRSGVCSDIFSNSCLEILSVNPCGLYIWDVLNCSCEQPLFEAAIELAYSNESALSFEDIFELAPQKFGSTAKAVDLSYRPITDKDGSIAGILVIAEDKTEELQDKQALEDRRKQSEALLRLVRSRNDYIEFLTKINSYFLSGSASGFLLESSLSTLKFSLHSLKGNAGSFYISDLVDLIHDFESFIEKPDTDFTAATDLIRENISKLSALIDHHKDFAETILGKGSLENGAVKGVEVAIIENFYSCLQNVLSNLPEGNQVLNDFYSKFVCTPVFDLFSNFEMALTQTCESLGKKIRPTVYSGVNFPIPLRRFQEVFSSFVLIAKNAIDHGIEDRGTRLSLGKDEDALIEVNVDHLMEFGTEYISITFRDDGSGIDPNKIRSRMREIGIFDENFTDHDVLNVIFDERFSSRETVSQISGRGVGLSAVKKAVEDVNGNISVKSQVNIGTEFVVRLPLSRSL